MNQAAIAALAQAAALIISEMQRQGLSEDEAWKAVRERLERAINTWNKAGESNV